MKPPVVDVVIAVHDPARQVGRAVESVISAAADVRVTVVCHGIRAVSIADVLPAGERVRAEEFSDGVPSPAGPFNHGLERADGEFVMIMGSDDYLEQDALDAWLDAARFGADVQIAPLRMQGSSRLANPLTRPWRRHRLDPIRDRLFHRSAPLALIRRELVPRAPLTPRMPAGEDLAWSTSLWTSGRRIDYDPTLPAYVIGVDAMSRVTFTPRPVAVLMEPIDRLLEADHITRQSSAVRAALTAKLLRVNVLGTMAARREVDEWTDDDMRAIALTIRRLEAFSPEGFRDLPRRDRDLLDMAIRNDVTANELIAGARESAGAGLAARLLPRSPRRAFGRESVLRRYARTALDGRN